MKTIWKYEIKEECAIEMPVGAELLTLREQGDAICLWALVDPYAPVEMRRFSVFGTGHSFDETGLHFIGSAHLQNGSFVFHVFEILHSGAIN